MPQQVTLDVAIGNAGPNPAQAPAAGLTILGDSPVVDTSRSCASECRSLSERCGAL